MAAAVFIGHGSPLNALDRNRYTEAWRSLGEAVPRPAAILAVSAHWYVARTAVTAMLRPPTIHDFFGFPEALARFAYPAPGHPALAQRVAELLGPDPVDLDQDWGLDHGTWSVLAHTHPRASVPVVQLAMDRTLGPAQHYARARRLRPLRDEGVLVLGSGNVVHNLARLRPAGSEPFGWAERFGAAVREAILAGDHEALVRYEQLDADAALSVPTPEHYLPLLYVLAQQQPGEQAAVLVDGIEMGSISMLSAGVGGVLRPAGD
jgi:4,5-DOPA dioxygenase extradiol